MGAPLIANPLDFSDRSPAPMWDEGACGLVPGIQRCEEWQLPKSQRETQHDNDALIKTTEDGSTAIIEQTLPVRDFSLRKPVQPRIRKIVGL
jgi:hypothetical protein